MKIIDFILCDDIRNEQANKLSIIGTYNDKIEFLFQPGQEIKWPINIRLAFYCRFLKEITDPEFDTIEFSMKLKDEEIVNFKAELTSAVDLSHPFILALPLPPVKVSGPGKLVPVFKIIKNNKILQEVSPSSDFKITVRKQ